MMSDGGFGNETQDAPYHSEFDDLFAKAWNDEFAPKEDTTDSEGGASTEGAGPGDTAPAATDQGAAAGNTDAATPPAGAQSATDVLAGAHDESGSAASTDTAGDTGTQQDSAGVPVDNGFKPFAELAAEALPQAQNAMQERMAQSFKAQAFSQVREELNPDFIKFLRVSPIALVGSEVPSIAVNARPGDTMRILDTQMARDWHEGVTKLIENEQQNENIRPLMSVIQDSFLMFQNNPDLFPYAAEFDQELADQFASIAEAYELRVDGKLFGYQVDVQPLINGLRSQLVAQRAVTGERQQVETRTVQQRQAAAAQPRTEDGRFDTPQAGIASKSGMEGEPDDDFSTFWGATPFKNMPNLNMNI
jgi:hypothetical protein